jgi:predicted ATP-grasp superfamily ATP-dependent carboligase
LPEVPPIATFHNKKLISPFNIHYSKKHNIIIVYGIIPTKGLEWKLKDEVHKLAEMLKAKQIISLEGIHIPGEEDTKDQKEVIEDFLSSDVKKKFKDEDCFYYTNSEKIEKKLKELRINQIENGYVMGVSGALLLSPTNINFTSLFVETEIELPDSTAAAKVVHVLNNVLDLNIDYKPLLKSSQQFENKLKMLLKNATMANKKKEMKEINYVG